MPTYQISVDGYAACGKSTLARGLADKLRFIYIDSGAMYRGVTFHFLENDISFDQQPPDSVLSKIDIEFEYQPQHADKLLLNGRDISASLRTGPVNENVSKIAAMPGVRRRLVALQQSYGQQQNVVMDGRDIGTVVFPEAFLKIFLTAALETRIYRRMNDAKLSDQETDYDKVKNNLLQRDHIDSTREDSPLLQADDAVLIDNTNLSIEEQLSMVHLLASMRME